MRIGFKTLGTRHCGSILIFTESILEECIFCRIAQRKVLSQILFEDDFVLAFKDINPVAPFHALVIPKKHIRSLNEISDPELIFRLIEACKIIAEQAGLLKGYRIVTNVGDDGGQTVFHLHFHVIGGRKMSWPPG